jgi:hypothetical protein
MGSQSKAVVRWPTAKCATVRLGDDSLMPEGDDVAACTAESLTSSRTVVDCNTTGANADDAAEWLARVLRCAIHGQGGNDPKP